VRRGTRDDRGFRLRALGVTGAACLVEAAGTNWIGTTRLFEVTDGGWGKLRAGCVGVDGLCGVPRTLNGGLPWTQHRRDQFYPSSRISPPAHNRCTRIQGDSRWIVMRSIIKCRLLLDGSHKDEFQNLHPSHQLGLGKTHTVRPVSTAALSL
jgi:hypothetical protein